jgi:hypothetical protein
MRKGRKFRRFFILEAQAVTVEAAQKTIKNPTKKPLPHLKQGFLLKQFFAIGPVVTFGSNSFAVAN